MSNQKRSVITSNWLIVIASIMVIFGFIMPWETTYDWSGFALTSTGYAVASTGLSDQYGHLHWVYYLPIIMAAAGLALITPLATEAINNLQTLSTTFPCAYALSLGFRDAVMTRPDAADYGQCSARHSALAQEWLFLGLVNYINGFVWRYFYRDAGVLEAHIEMYGGARVYLPLVIRR